MFNLIITLVSIGLVAALALATLFYGGDIFKSAKEGAEVSRLMSESSQIRAAASAHAARESSAANTVQELVDKEYLKPAINGRGWSATSGMVKLTDVPDDRCLAFNKKHGIETVPACSDPAYDGKIVCCDEAL